MNSDGFRTIEFDKVDWENSYVIIGVHMLRLGNPYKTICEYIKKTFWDNKSLLWFK